MSYSPAKTTSLKLASFFALSAALMICEMALAQQTDPPPLIRINQPDGSVEEVDLEPGSTAYLDASGNIIVDSETALLCDGGCQVELDFFRVSSGAQSANDGGSLSVPQGNSLIFEWSSRGGWTCAADGLPGSGVWEGSATKAYRTYGSQSTGNVVATNDLQISETPYDATITCATSAGTAATGSIAITITDPNPNDPEEPAFCNDRASLSELTNTNRAVDVLLGNDSEDGFSFASVFGAEFPGFSAPQKSFRLFDGFYASMQFDTPAALSGAGKMFFNELAGTAGGDRIVAISPCEGDFNPVGLPDHCVQKLSGTTSFRWTTSPDDRLPGCNLEGGRSYYFNIIYSSNSVGDWPVQFDCPFYTGTDRCGHSISKIIDNVYD